jgi:hypothetical protein
MFIYLKANLFNDLFMSLKKILNLAFLLLKYFSDGIFFRVLHEVEAGDRRLGLETCGVTTVA